MKDKKVTMTSILTMTKTEYTFLKCLSLILHQPDKTDFISSLTSEELGRVLALADRHEVLALLENILESDKLSEEQQLTVQFKTAKTVHTSIQLQVLNERLTTMLDKEGIQAITLKGGGRGEVLSGSGISEDNGY